MNRIWGQALPNSQGNIFEDSPEKGHWPRTRPISDLFPMSLFRLTYWALWHPFGSLVELLKRPLLAPYLGTPSASYLSTIWAPHIGVFGLPVWAPVVETPAPYWFPIWASLLGPLAQAKHVRFLAKNVRMLGQVAPQIP